uniref:WH2 domain-containing protein n=1 Tax=Steinernema glaseri TaxID=37863 RepID=A0A1I8AIL5_9BILA
MGLPPTRCFSKARPKFPPPPPPTLQERILVPSPPSSVKSYKRCAPPPPPPPTAVDPLATPSPAPSAQRRSLLEEIEAETGPMPTLNRPDSTPRSHATSTMFPLFRRTQCCTTKPLEKEMRTSSATSLPQTIDVTIPPPAPTFPHVPVLRTANDQGSLLEEILAETMPKTPTLKTPNKIKRSATIGNPYAGSNILEEIRRGARLRTVTQQERSNSVVNASPSVKGALVRAMSVRRRQIASSSESDGGVDIDWDDFD